MADLSWEEEFNALVADFVDNADARLLAFRSALDSVTNAPTDPDPFRELRRHFHRLAGTGLTFGFAEISALASQGEELCDQRLKAGEPPTPEDIARCRTLVDAIEAGFAGARTGLRQWRAPAGTPEAQREPHDILIVDADDAIQKRLFRLLTAEGMLARPARSISEARELIDAKMPDGVIVEITLPDGEGYSVVTHVRSRVGGDQVAVVMLSNFNAFLDQTDAIHAGADVCFEKPLDLEALVIKLQQLLEREVYESPRILVVEDDESQAAFVRATLEQARYKVRIVPSPMKFNDELSSYRPDLLILDINLPGVSGYDLARFVRQGDKHATMPIIFLTGDSHQQARIATAVAGGDDHLTKPVHPNLLVASVAARLERARFVKMLLSRDGLTRVLTHSSFMEQALALVERRRHESAATPATMVMLDLDHFKTINDTYGHQAGDSVLKRLSALLRRHVRRSDLVGRYGGEEFAILLDYVHGDDAVRLMNRLLEDFAKVEHQSPDGQLFRCTFSAGVASLETPAMNLDGWFMAADQALYEAKRTGRQRVVKAP